MEIPSLKAFLNSISQFSVISSNSGVKSELVRRYCQNIDEILNLLKPVFDEIVYSEIVADSEIASGEDLNKVLEELEALFNDARELVESWHQMTSKFYFVLQIESVITKIQATVLETYQLLRPVFQSLDLKSGSACFENCIQKMQDMDYKRISDVIKEIMRSETENVVSNAKHLVQIADTLSLSSNQELLMEVVALEKLKTKIGRGENHREVEYIDHMIALITHMHDHHVKVKQLHSMNGVPIPADFCCPLSLELMSDPVIVASGQTYERAFIQKWLDLGFTVCPKTRQTLGHTNLIPNYTVKALIANWCETNNIKLPDPLKSLSLNQPSSFLARVDFNADDSIIFSSGRSPRSSHPKSPETIQSVISMQKNSLSSNGRHQEGHLNDRPTSPPHSHLASTGSPLHVASGIEANISRVSLANSNGKGSSQGEQDDGFGGLTSNQTENECSHTDEQLQGHNRTASASSAISCTDYTQGAGDSNMVSWVSSDLTHYSSDASGEVRQEAPAASASQREPEIPPTLVESQSRNHMIWRRPSENFVRRIISSSSLDQRPDLSGIEAQVRKLIEDLRSDSVDLPRAATAELRLLAKHNMENRIVIANCGAISLLVGLLHSMDSKTQENSVTALLNLSINDNNKTAIVNADAIDPLIHVLETGDSEAKENAAATLFSLSVIEENKVRIGRSGAIQPLVELLGNGTPRGKKDAATALFNLSIFHENKARIVQAGAVRHLVELMDPAAGMVDKAVAVLSNLSTLPEGRTAIGHEGGIPVLVEVVELGSARGKENAAAALLQLCINSNRFCTMVLQEGAVPPLVALLQSGTPRAKEKAQALLSHFRNQRHGNAGRA